jgi:hypothetical protein
MPSPAPDPDPDPNPDPMPEPPPQPDLDACCGNGCDPCIFDLHELEMDKYRQALRAWRVRHPEVAGGDGR